MRIRTLPLAVLGVVLALDARADLVDLVGADGAAGARGADGGEGESIDFEFTPLLGPPHEVSVAAGAGGVGGVALPGDVGGTGGTGGTSIFRLDNVSVLEGLLAVSSVGGPGGAGGPAGTDGTLGDGGAGGNAELHGVASHLLSSASAIGGRGGDGHSGGQGGTVYASQSTLGAQEVWVHILGGAGGNAVGPSSGSGGNGGWVLPEVAVFNPADTDLATYVVTSGDGGSVLDGSGDGGDSGEIRWGPMMASRKSVVNLTSGDGGDARGEGHRGGQPGGIVGEIGASRAGGTEIDVLLKGGSGGDGLDGALAGSGGDVSDYLVSVEDHGPIDLQLVGVGGEAGTDAFDPGDRTLGRGGGSVDLGGNLRGTGDGAISAEVLAVSASYSSEPKIDLRADHAGTGDTSLLARGVLGDFTLGEGPEVDVRGTTASGALTIYAESAGGVAAPGMDGGTQLKGVDDRRQHNHVTADGHSSGGGDVSITVIEQGQHAGAPVVFTPLAGADVALVEAATGSTSGGLTIHQNAIAGDGAPDLKPQIFGGHGGDAYSVLNVSTAGSLVLRAEATGGKAGAQDLGSWGTPGNATASARGAGAVDPVEVSAGAHAGDVDFLADRFPDSFYSGGSGGRADADATAVGLGEARAHAVADAGRFGFHGALFPPDLVQVAPPPIANAVSTAQGSTGFASALATASFLDNKPDFDCAGAYGSLANACSVALPEVSATAVSRIGATGQANARAQASVLSFTDLGDSSTESGAYAVIEAVPFTTRVDSVLIDHPELQGVFDTSLALGALGVDVPDDFDPMPLEGVLGSRVTLSFEPLDVDLSRLSLGFLGAGSDLAGGDLGELALRVTFEEVDIFERIFTDLAEALMFFDDTLLALDTHGVAVTDSVDIAVVLEVDDTTTASRFGFSFLLGATAAPEPHIAALLGLALSALAIRWILRARAEEGQARGHRSDG